MNTYERYAKLREAAEVTDAKVAAATGIDKVVFSEWKKGRSNPKVDKVKKIADYFEVRLDFFYKEFK